METVRSAMLTIGIMLTVPFSYAQMPVDVHETLGKVAKAYAQVTEYSTVIERSEGAGGSQVRTTMTLTVQKPDKLVAAISMPIGVRRMVVDGARIYRDASYDRATFTEQPIGGMDNPLTMLGHFGEFGESLLPMLLTAPDRMQTVLPGSIFTWKRMPDETIDGVVCDVFIAHRGNADDSARQGFAFGKDDHLLRRETLTLAKQTEPIVVAVHTKVTSTPKIVEGMFTYTPVPGAVAMVLAAPEAPVLFDPRVKVGAEPLAIIGRDLTGREVSLDQYHGKVLLIDFWALWCVPCIAELPNVVEAYNKYHAQGFEVLGISLDPANAEANLLKFTAENKMPWRQVYDGKEKQSATAKAWGVTAIPFTVLIGRDGKIAAVGVRGPKLAPAIEAALKEK